jgi:hypothetical protein
VSVAVDLTYLPYNKASFNKAYSMIHQESDLSIGNRAISEELIEIDRFIRISVLTKDERGVD